MSIATILVATFHIGLYLRNGSKGKVDHRLKDAVSVVFDGDTVLLHIDGGETADGVLAADRLIDSAVNFGDIDLTVEGDSKGPNSVRLS